MLKHSNRVQRMRKITARLVQAMAIGSLLFAVSTVHAQLVNGVISGTVVDQVNSPVSEVEVTITNQDTKITQTKKTDEDGIYQFAALPPGVYTVEFMKSGFQTSTVKDITVITSNERTVDRTLKVASTASNVTVTADPEVTLSKSSPSIQMTLPSRVMDLTPLSTTSLYPAGARNMARYALFSSGVVRVAGQNEISTNGHRGRENNFMLDGVDNNDNTVTLPAAFAPTEAIQEFQVQTTPYSAEFGHSMGAQVNAITRSGTNAFHGDLWEFYRGNALEPLSLQSRRAGLTSSPHLVDNQFGADIGGPIIQDKTFFFGLIQGNRQRAPKPYGLVTIPTATGLATLATVPLRTASGTVPAQTAASRQSMLDALNFLNSVYPKISHYDSLSTITVNSIPIEMGSYNPQVPMDQNLWYGVARIDHQITANDRISYRFHIDDRDSPLSNGNLAFGEQWGVDSSTLAQNHALSYTKNVGESFVNEARFSYARLAPVFTERDPVSPTVNVGSNPTLFTIGGLSTFPQERLEQTYQFQNVSTYSMNRHSFKFGLDLARTHLFNNNAMGSRGTWGFNNLTDFMNNQANSLTQLVSTPTVYSFTQLRQAYFFQDDIKVSRSFTANLGLRYETSAVPADFFGATDPTVLASNVPGPGKRDTNNWGPRVGFAYSPTSLGGILGDMLGSGKSVIRGGFGMGYDVLFYNLLGNPAANYPRTNTQTNTAATLVDVYPTLLPKTNVVTFNPMATFVNLPADTQNPTTNYWSLSLQRQLNANFIIEVGYIGNRSYHLLRQGQANPGTISQAKADAVIAGCTATNLTSCQDPTGFPTSPSRLDPSLGSRILLEATGEASYNAGYVQVDKRLSHGLQFGANYTWSTNISDSEEVFADSTTTDGGIAASSPQVPQNYLDRRAERARSVFDRPNRFTVHETYAIPFFSDAPKALKLVFSDWQVSGFTEIQSGQPFTITVGVDTLGSGTGVPGRPDFNPGGIMIPDPVTGNFRTFIIPLDGTGIVTAPHVTNAATGAITFLKNSMPVGGTLGRNTFRGPGYSNTNMSLMKRFKFQNDMSLEIRGDFLNLFNHDNFQNPVANMSSPNFGKNVFVPLTDARQVLLGAKFRF
jgi:hypothetical protein